MFHFIRVRVTVVLIVAVLLASSSMWVAAQDTPAPTDSANVEIEQFEEEPVEEATVSPESVADDGDSPTWAGEEPVSAAAVDAYNAPGNWTIGGRLGIRTQTPSYDLDLIHSYNSTTRALLRNLDAGSSAVVDIYLNTGTNNGVALQKFGSGVTKEWDDITLGGWARLRTDTNTKGLILSTGGARPLILGTNDEQSMIIDPNGKVQMNNSLRVLRNIRTDGTMSIYGEPNGEDVWAMHLDWGKNVQNEYVASMRFRGPSAPQILDIAGSLQTNVLKIDGGGDLAEPFDINGTERVEPGMVVAIDPENPGELRVADKAYDRTVVGIVSGAGGINPGLVLQQEGSIIMGEHPVALTGRVYVMADASNGEIEPGDLLTTSDIPGHAMKVTDYDLAQGAILGKAMTGIDAETGLVLVLVSLQ